MEDVAVTLLRILVAVAHQGNVPLARHRLDQPQRGLLSVVLDGLVA
jgi:hypothetical protein